MWVLARYIKKHKLNNGRNVKAVGKVRLQLRDANALSLSWDQSGS